MRNPKVVDLAVEYRHRTALAVLVHDGNKDVWIPKRIAEFDPDPFEEDAPPVIASMTVTVPYWFAHKEGLI